MSIIAVGSAASCDVCRSVFQPYNPAYTNGRMTVCRRCRPANGKGWEQCHPESEVRLKVVVPASDPGNTGRIPAEDVWYGE